MVRKHYYIFCYSRNMLKIRSHGFDRAQTVMLIKCSKQIANSFPKYLMVTKANSKPCQTSEMEFFPRSRYWLKRRTQNLAKHLRWSFLQKYSKTKSHSLLMQTLASWMFDKVLNMLLNWCRVSCTFSFYLAVKYLFIIRNI